MASFFGGDPNVAHFVAGVRYLLSRDEPSGEAKARRREQGAKLKALGFKKRYFKFRAKGDEAAKAKAKAECEAFAREWSERVGFDLEVAEGCFL